MQSFSTFVFSGLVAYAFLYGVIRFSLSTEAFRKQSAEDQERARKQYKQVLRYSPLGLLGAYLLTIATSGVLKWILLLLYLSLWTLAIWLVRRAYKIGLGGSETPITSSTGKTLKLTGGARKALAVLHLCTGLALAVLLICVIAFALPLQHCASIIAVLSSLHVLVRHQIEKRSEA